MVLKIYNKISNRIINAKRKELLSNLNIKIGSNFEFNFMKNSFDVRHNAKIDIGNNVIFREYCSILAQESGILTLGNNVFFNKYSSINCLGEIEIGDYTIFGEGVRLYDHNHIHKGKLKDILQLTGCSKGTIKIGRNCWIGANAIILNNVSIGDNVIIGAGNLIYKDIPSNVIIMQKAEYIIKDRI